MCACVRGTAVDSSTIAQKCENNDVIDVSTDIGSTNQNGYDRWQAAFYRNTLACDAPIEIENDENNNKP